MSASVIMPVGGEVHEDAWRRRALAWVCNYYETRWPEIEMAFGFSSTLPYNRSQARNVAFDNTSGDVLIIADADTVPNRESLGVAIGLVSSGQAPWAVPYGEDRYYNLSANRTEEVLAGGADIDEPTDEDDWEHKITSFSGCLVLRRSSWLKVGGYDERFTGWGYEDDAFRVVLDGLVGPCVRVDGYICHLWHPTSEDIRFGQPNIAKNRALLDEVKRSIKGRGA